MQTSFFRTSLLALKEVLPPSPVTRFAPSPSGYLHMGHLLSIICVFGITEWLGGRVLLRIEDHDKQRSRNDYTDSFFEDLEWLGFIPDNWDVVRSGTDFWQSRCEERYREALASLQNRELTYCCDCSRRQCAMRYPEQETLGESYYGGYCRDRVLDPGLGRAIRFKMPAVSIHFEDLWHGSCYQHPHEQCGDCALVDRHGNFTYTFAVVCDDLAQGIDFVIRGSDLLSSTGRQLILAQSLGRKNPLYFGHHPLLLGDDGQKLSKRFLSTSLRERRQSGLTPEAVIGEALWLAGLQKRQMPISRRGISEYLIALFSKSVD